MNSELRWGILGTGNIARQFCVGVNASTRGRLAAVGSRSMQAAAAFAETHRIPRAFGSYDELLADRTVEAVYVSLPNTLHHSWTIKALHAGKHVLCEKPFADNVRQAREMFDAAKAAGRLLVEAFMYRSHPLTTAYLDKIRRGDIGTVRLIRANFCYRTTKVTGNVRFAPELAGGAIMDIGCYCVSFARMITGEEPTAISVSATRHETGVDGMAVGTLRFPSGVQATFTCGMIVQADNTASVCGTEGYLEVPIPWKPPVTGAQFTVGRATPPRMEQTGLDAVKSQPNSSSRQTFTVDAGRDLYSLEADDFAAAVLDAANPVVTREDTIGNMVVLDELRRQIREQFDSAR